MTQLARVKYVMFIEMLHSKNYNKMNISVIFINGFVRIYIYCIIYVQIYFYGNENKCNDGMEYFFNYSASA